MKALLRPVLALAAILVVVGPWAITASPAHAGQVRCGATLTANTTLDRDLLNCPGDGLIIGADNITVNLNGHTITGRAHPGSAGIRNVGHTGVKIQDGDFSGLDISGFETGILLKGVRNNLVRGLFVEGVSFGIALVDSDRNTIENNGTMAGSTNVCDRVRAAGIALFDSDRNWIQENAAELTDFGIVLVNSNHNQVEKNEAAPRDSDGNQCDGVSLFNSKHNEVEKNITAQNDHDGILVKAGSSGTLIARNVASFNGDDGIDVDDPATTIRGNTANNNGDLGIEAVKGVIDGGGNQAAGNGNPAQCRNVACR
jgi:parallel beta-helix repeat protein